MPLPVETGRLGEKVWFTNLLYGISKVVFGHISYTVVIIPADVIDSALVPRRDNLPCPARCTGVVDKQ